MQSHADGQMQMPRERWESRHETARTTVLRSSPAVHKRSRSELTVVRETCVVVLSAYFTLSFMCTWSVERAHGCVRGGGARGILRASFERRLNSSVKYQERESNDSILGSYATHSNTCCERSVYRRNIISAWRS